VTIHVFSQIRAMTGKRDELTRVVTTQLKPIMERAGWKFVRLYLGITGPAGMLVVIWELTSLADYELGRALVAGYPEFPEVRMALDRLIAEETIYLLDAD
jgi:hypothetical protein